MGKRIWTFLCILILLTFSLSGCYYFSATKEMKAAEQLISELKAAGGATLVPYEYCSAEKFLENAKLEADQSDWKHARDFSSRSKSAADAGLAQVKKK
jgi:cytochrome c biogenesis protein ResB